MTFAPTVELYYDGAWQTVPTSDVYMRTGGRIEITRGRPDKAARTDPGKCTLQLNNRLGRYSPRNPMSPLYGKIGRNTPLRVTVGTPSGAAESVATDTFTRAAEVDQWGTAPSGQVWRRRGGDATERATTGTAATLTLDANPAAERMDYLDISLADCEVLYSVALDQTATGGRLTSTAVLRRIGASQDYQWYEVGPTFEVDGSMRMRVLVPSGVLGAEATTAVTYTPGAKRWVRVRVEGYRIRGRLWADGSAEPSTWDIDRTVTAVADQVPTGGVGLATYGSSANTNTDPVFTYDDFTAYDLTPDDRRFVGEVSSWPTRWDVTGRDVWVPIEAQGILRRLGQGESPLRSPIYRELTAGWRTPMVAYWPMEDGSDSTTLASATGGQPMTITGTPQIGAFGGFAGSEPLPTLADASLTGQIPAHTDTGEILVRLLLDTPAAGHTDGQRVITVYTTGTAARWELKYRTAFSGSIDLLAYDADGTNLLTTSFTFGAGLNGTRGALGLTLTEDGADVDYQVVYVVVTSADATGTAGSGTLTGQTCGRATRIVVARDRGLTEGSVGHLVVSDNAGQLTGEDDWLHGWVGETAGTRMRRLCAESGVPFVSHYDLSATTAMGPQRTGTLVDLLETCASADGGILHELRSLIGLGYRPRTSLYNQSAALALDYDGGHVSPPFEPAADDAEARNDVTVQRDGGSSARVEQTAGPLNVSDPADDPEGVGRYDEQVTLSLKSDGQCLSQAGWRVHLGTWDEERYPSVAVNLGRNTSLVASVTAVDSGDRITVTDPPSWMPPDDIELMLQGYSESFDAHWWDWTANASPYGPWFVFQIEDPVLGRLDTSGSEIASAPTTATAAGNSSTRDYIVVPDAEAVGFAVGNRIQLFSSAGALKEGVTFTVTSKVSAFGFTNIVFTPLATTAPVTGDEVRRADDTTLLVATDSGKLPWITTADRPQDFNFNVRAGGEVMTVTGITGETSPQTFTVTRGVNGIYKAHPPGTRLQLARLAVA